MKLPPILVVEVGAVRLSRGHGDGPRYGISAFAVCNNEQEVEQFLNSPEARRILQHPEADIPITWNMLERKPSGKP